MTKSMSSSPAQLTDRVTELEILTTHLQREIAELNGVILEQQQMLEKLSLVVSRLDHRIIDLEADDEVRDPEAERPPHY